MEGSRRVCRQRWATASCAGKWLGATPASCRVCLLAVLESCRGRGRPAAAPSRGICEAAAPAAQPLPAGASTPGSSPHSLAPHPCSAGALRRRTLPLCASVAVTLYLLAAYAPLSAMSSLSSLPTAFTVNSCGGAGGGGEWRSARAPPVGAAAAAARGQNPRALAAPACRRGSHEAADRGSGGPSPRGAATQPPSPSHRRPAACRPARAPGLTTPSAVLLLTFRTLSYWYLPALALP